MPPPTYRQQLWRSVPLGRAARVGLFQVVASVVLFAQAEPGSLLRVAIVFGGCVSLATLPLARLCAAHSRNHPRVYWWAGRVWTASLPLFFTLTVADAYDGTGAAFAERATAPFVMAAVVGLSFAIGAQGALLGVPADALGNMAAVMLGMAALKLRVAYTPAYLLLHVGLFGGITIGYACVSKYADVHEALRDAAEDVVVGAAAREPFVVTDAVMHIRAVNQRLLDVLGYEEEELVGRPVMELLYEASSWGGDHAWIRRTLFEAAARKENTNGHVWSLRSKDGHTHPVRITLGETRCPVSAMRMFTAQFTCMRMEQRNQQLKAEKERLQWDLVSSGCHECENQDSREALGARVAEGAPHRTLGAMQDQAKTDDAVSCALSFDHVDSSVASPSVPGHTLIAPARPKTPSSIASLKSSVMDTVSEAAKKSPTRAPPPSKESRLPRPKKVCSEPSTSAKPKAGNSKKSTKRAVPAIERDPRECS